MSVSETLKAACRAWLDTLVALQDAQANCARACSYAEEVAAIEFPEGHEILCVVVGKRAVYFHTDGKEVVASFGVAPSVVEV